MCLKSDFKNVKKVKEHNDFGDIEASTKSTLAPKVKLVKNPWIYFGNP